MMGASSTPQADLTPQADQAALERFADAAADDLEMLALLHGAELGPDVLSALHEQQIRDFLGLVPVGSAARGWLSALEAAIKLLPRPDDAAGIDALAADYADIYLRYHYRAAPTESVWRDPDGLERQEPMFRVRKWFRRMGYEASDPARRSEDHIVLQLRFLSWLISSPAIAGKLDAAGDFLDQHLLTWTPRLAARLAETQAPPFYAALAGFTAAWLDELRSHLTEITGRERRIEIDPARDTADNSQPKADRDAPRYVPGLAPSW